MTRKVDLIVLLFLIITCKPLSKLERVGKGKEVSIFKRQIFPQSYFKTHDQIGIPISCNDFQFMVKHYTSVLDTSIYDTLTVSDYINLERIQNTIAYYDINCLSDSSYHHISVIYMKHCNKVGVFYLLKYNFLGSISYSEEYHLQSGFTNSIDSSSLFNVCKCFFEECN